ncbi:MAG: hypothetical protein CSB06_01740 [Bacteroidia bacterium]|nr:MAG: hypothetical protein CSB06_01740 [Bacteroidia bacterium]
MNKKLQQFRILIVLMLMNTSAVITAQAQEFTINKLKYKVISTTPAEVEVKKSNIFPNGAVTIPSSVTNSGKTYTVTQIAESGFTNCKLMTSVMIPNTVKTIGTSAFRFCTQITTINIPQNVKTIKQQTFESCSALQTITIPSNSEITSIEANAFDGCEALKNFTIPDKVESIGNFAFVNCTALENVTIPALVTSISNDIFSGCSSLAAINVTPSNSTYSSIDGVLFNNAQTILIRYPMGKILTTYNVPASVKVIENSAFKGSSLPTINLGNAIETIGNLAFHNCEKLKSIDLKSVKTIEREAFRNCGLTSITIPNSIQVIEEQVFANCKNLTSINFGTGVNTISSRAFFHCGLTTVTIPNSIHTIGDNAFDNCEKLTEVNIGSAVANIGTNLFADCEKLSAINVDEANTKFCSDEGVFFNKDKDLLITYPIGKTLTEYTVPQSVQTIGESAFEKSSLQTINITNNVRIIGKNSFNGCSALEKINFPNSITNIGRFALYNCSNLQKIHSSINKVNAVTVGNYAFDNANNTTCILYVPKGKKTDYKNKEPWDSFKNIQEIAKSVVSVSLNENAKTINISESFKLVASIDPSDADNKDLAWSSSDNKIAKVDNTGNVTGIGAGTATITVTTIDGGKTASCEVTVNSTKISLTVSLIGKISKEYDGTTKASLTADNYKLVGVGTGDKVNLSNTTGVFADKNVGTGKKITVTGLTLIGKDKDKYFLSATEVSGTIGEITPKAITVTADNKSKVTGNTDPALTYTVKPALCNGDKFTGSLKRTAGESLGDYDILQGNLDAGTNYNISFVKGTLSIVENAIAVTGVSIECPNNIVKVGETIQLTARINPDNATNQNVTWESSNKTTATIDAKKGLVTAIAIGTTTITVTTEDGKFSATCLLTIEASSGMQTLRSSILKLYPNPVESICTLETSNLGILKIYSLNGKQVRTIPITSNKQQIDLNNLQSGIYIAKINNKVIRLVKQ